MGVKLTVREQRRADAAAWVTRNLHRWPEGVRATDIAAVVRWERARFDGKVDLETPDVYRNGKPLPQDCSARKLLDPFIHPTVFVYTRKVGERRSDWGFDRVHWSLAHTNPKPIGKALAGMYRAGALSRRRVAGQWVYGRPERLVFGAVARPGERGP